MPSGIKRTHEEFIQLFQENNKNSENIEIIGEYQTNVTPISCRCRICGYEWMPIPKLLLKGCGCPKCAGNIKFTQAEFVELFKKVNPNAESIEFIGEYKSMAQKIKCRCSVCAYEWDARCGDLIYSKSGCPSCSGNTTYTNDRFIYELRKRNQNIDSITLLSQYTGTLERIHCRCNVCGHEWYPMATSLRQGSGCPECAKKRLAQVAGEQLRNLPKPKPITHDEFLAKFKKENPYNEKISILSQYQGANKYVECSCNVCGTKWNVSASSLISGSGCPKCSHSSTSFMEQFIAESLKKVLCEESILQRDRRTIGKELDIYLPAFGIAIEIGSWKWHKSIYTMDLQKQELCTENGIRLIIIYDLCADSIEPPHDVYCYSYDLGAETQHKTLRMIVHMLLNEMNIQYSFSKEEWEEITKLSYKNSQRIDHARFLDKFQEQNPTADTIEILSQYTRAVDRIKCRCKVCNHMWEPAATDLLRGSGCPKCKMVQASEKLSKKHIIIEWRQKNPNGSKLRCEKETGISRMTVYKWWEAEK